MTSIIAVLIILGGLSGVSAWIIGPTKGLMVSARDGSLPAKFARTNKHGAPTTILFAQAVIFTFLSSAFILFDSINAAYWLLSDLCAQMALLVYVFMFAAAIKLRYSKPHHPRGYTVPGGNIVMWLLCIVGTLCCLAAIIIGFVPPTQIPVGNVFIFESFLVGGLFIFVLVPWLLSKKH